MARRSVKPEQTYDRVSCHLERDGATDPCAGRTQRIATIDDPGGAGAEEAAEVGPACD